MNMENENSKEKTEKLKNEPAFPSKHSNEQFLHSETVYKGLTMRDYFAGQALVGISAAFYGSQLTTKTIRSISDERGISPDEFVAAASYTIADYMLKERSKYE